MNDGTGEYPVTFSPNQKLPPNYRVEYWECDEHYHWVKDKYTAREIESVAFSCRFHARRSAWAHYRENK